jgi:hypothetical protein
VDDHITVDVNRVKALLEKVLAKNDSTVNQADVQ